ncbi:MAG: tRNA 2-thiouridine(34) synthase MnmA [Clostridia bacterium]|nr:tRNA 2-thiouridine(34) synthase MnmA [Clostridia bacterium]
MSKVIVGMSGGVDSAVAAFLLKQQGYEVIGVTLRTWQSPDGNDSRCCEIDDARESARLIGIPYYVFNCTGEFEKKIIEPFVSDYINGRTPNPCVICNREIKWELLTYYANVLGAEYVATGHYASVIRLENGRFTVGMADHAEKDQTYMLYRLTQDQLKRTVMPLGAYSKREVRSIAEKAGLQVAAKPDSQEICFVTKGNYADFITYRKGVDFRPDEGNFVDESGKVLGRHRGIIHYTVGQRKGLSISLGCPVYVKEIRAEKNEIVLSASPDGPDCKTLVCRDLNFMSVDEPRTGERISCRVKVRYRHSGQSALIEKTAADTVAVTFYEPVRFAAPGQSAVFYDRNGYLIGGGIISEIVS